MLHLPKNSWVISGHSVRQTEAVSKLLGSWWKVGCEQMLYWRIMLSNYLAQLCAEREPSPQGWETSRSQEGNQHFIKVNDQGYTSSESWLEQDSNAKWILFLLPLLCFGPVFLFVFSTVVAFNACIYEKALKKIHSIIFSHLHQFWLSEVFLLLFYFPRGNISNKIKHRLPDGPFLVRKFKHEAKQW